MYTLALHSIRIDVLGLLSRIDVLGLFSSPY